MLRLPVLFILQLYKNVLSPMLPAACRFEPTCSVYAMEAVQKYGAIKGSWLAAKRVFRCRPGCPGGHDPVP